MIPLKMNSTRIPQPNDVIPKGPEWPTENPAKLFRKELLFVWEHVPESFFEAVGS